MNIVGKRFLFFIISGIVMLAGIVSLLAYGLQPGIEFTSGSEMTANFQPGVDKAQIAQALADAGYAPSATVIRQSGTGFIIDLPVISDADKQALTSNLTSQLGAVQITGFDNISPTVASETTRNAAIAIAAAAIGILLYITFAFRKMPNPFRYGTCAVIALAHDIVVVVGVFSIIGALLGWEINLMFITGILAILGYSVNNNVIIFDRIRENLMKGRSGDFEKVVNNSVVETITRSFNTNLTTLFPIIALLIIVGASIQNLLVVLLVGIIIGTYDSICVAPGLLVVWEKNEWGRFIGRKAAA
jgi:preprotein translocase subunit SecF